MTIDSSDSNDRSEAHGALRFQAGFDVVEVVAEYNALREVLCEFAEERDMSLEGRVARLINRTLDHAIACAVKAYEAEKTIELQRRREEHLSFLIHDLKTPIAAISIEVSDDLSVVADANAICRVFQNLLSNAIQHTKQGRIVLGGTVTQNGFEFWVQDSGEGIAPERLEKIFEKLETDRMNDGGMGLGLAIVKEIVEAHDATVTVVSELS